LPLDSVPLFPHCRTRDHLLHCLCDRPH
jgi:hypothetical protein